MKNVITKTLVASAISTAMLAGAAQAAVTMVSWGGGYSASQQKAYVDTYSSGEINMISYNGGLGEVRAQVESGNVVWDIVDVLPSQARTGCDEGLFEELDRSIFLPAPDVLQWTKTLWLMFQMTVLFRKPGGHMYLSTMLTHLKVSNLQLFKTSLI